ncbi:hypothetical protein LVD15_20750 [Fulvivirga maritima]|uniref:hypothetical protein n=1 Tax=Fulvivirga maritima TaxID=2904247 RepID=UPI001F454E8D|nr:hypothetical protein [Fulvivirga maritima]UII25712.1 hypothetical protein LVD15_20750 [Fulvivirga maritima]
MNLTDMHKFHIPVMGLAFTIDSPVKVARFGINSVVSIIQDKLIETTRRHYYQTWGEKFGLTYEVISDKSTDYRARRITDYLNLINKIVRYQVDEMKQGEFGPGSDLNKYFEMLPDENPLRQVYFEMQETTDDTKKKELADFLKSNIKAGRIDVNIMTKLDRPSEKDDLENNTEALSALRGYAMSDLKNSSIVFSAGMNPNLFSYIEHFECFKAKADNRFDKDIVVKVSDYRSALVQGKFLAKKGIWVSEFRIESGLNCGGHAFATPGFLIGPILEDFKTNKEGLIEDMFNLYKKANEEKGEKISDQVPKLRITVQGGIGTYEEADFLERHYQVDGTGWGSPFLLVPEATTVDEETLNLLCNAHEDDVVLSKNSPLGVRFNYLKGTSSEREKLARIESGKPGSPCTEKHLALNTEFTEDPICTASKKYQKLKMKYLKSLNLPKIQFEKEVQEMQTVECLCVGLSNSVARNYDVPFVKGLPNVTICPGPNIAYFNKKVSLKEMVDHIYGRINLLANSQRPHMFIKELSLYVDYFKEQLTSITDTLSTKEKRTHTKFYKQIIEGVTYYRDMADQILQKSDNMKASFIGALNHMEDQLDSLFEAFCVEPAVKSE